MEVYHPLTFASYYVVCVVACVLAKQFGGKPEQRGAAVVLITSIASSFLTFGADHPYRGVETGLLAIDATVLATFVWLALNTDRFWPLWASAFQLITVLTHLVRAVDPATLPLAYAYAEGFWAYPVLGALLVACERGRRLRKSMRPPMPMF